MAPAAGEPEARRRHHAVCSLLSNHGKAAHERLTTIAIAERVAALIGLPFAGDFATRASADRSIYLVPDDTVVGLRTARELGIRDEEDLFGGVVRHPFLATKAITHPLIGPQAAAPAGWVQEFGAMTTNAVLPGFTAFSAEDARCGGAQLLKRGPVRLKPTDGRGGRGQVVLHGTSDLRRAIGDLEDDALSTCGVVLEENLASVSTVSVGYLRLAGMDISYCGRQRLTKDNIGKPVYGGSDLELVRGGPDALAAAQWSEAMRLAILQAQQYDAAAMRLFDGICASRRNYDVAVGTTHDGQRRSGVLEQSWRIGGATSAEVLALELFRQDPGLEAVRASAVEAYGARKAVPADAVIFFSGEDPDAGPITKFARVESHGRADLQN